MDSEKRLHAVGAIPGSLLILTVVHTYFDDNTTEIIRIISARSATKEEMNRYVEAL